MLFLELSKLAGRRDWSRC